MSRKPKKEVKPKPIKKIPLITGVIFIIIGIVCLALVFTSPESAKATYALMVVTFMGFGVDYLNKSGILER